MIQTPFYCGRRSTEIVTTFIVTISGLLYLLFVLECFRNCIGNYAGAGAPTGLFGTFTVKVVVFRPSRPLNTYFFRFFNNS